MNLLSNIFKAKWSLIAIAVIFLTACDEVQQKEISEPKKDSIETPVTERKLEKKYPKEEDEYTEARVDLKLSKEDINYLMLTKEIPLGCNFKKIQEELPNIKGVLKPEGGPDALAGQGLTELKTQVIFLGKPADLELNFKNDSLYSFYYTVQEEDFNKAERLYKGLQQFYNKKIGQGAELIAEEETRDIRTSVWKENFPYCIINYNINTGVISWGFQNNRP